MEKSGLVPAKTNSLEDFSEYVDAEESVSAPTELLAEFLYTVMVKDYEKALGYCMQILRYEPNNATVKEFCPLIEEKLEILRNEELEGSSSDSSLTSSSSTSSSTDNLRIIKNEKSWEKESECCSSLESDNESNENTGTSRSNISQSDITNGNVEKSSATKEKQTKSNNEKGIKSSATRTIIPKKLPARQTQTKILRRDSFKDGRNNAFNLKNGNPTTLLHPTDTVIFGKQNSSRQDKDNARRLSWFSSLQENIFGNKKREIPSVTKNPVQNSTCSKEKKTK